MKAEDLKEIVMKIIGPVQPVGETNEDQRRLANIKLLTGLVDRLLFEISSAAASSGRVEASMKAIGSYAKAFMDEVREVEEIQA